MAGAPPQVEHNVWEGGPVAWLLVPAAVQQRSVGCQTLWGWGVARQPLRWRHLQPAALDDPIGLLQAGQWQAAAAGQCSAWQHRHPLGSQHMKSELGCSRGLAHLPGVEASGRPRHLPCQQLPQHHAKGEHVCRTSRELMSTLPAMPAASKHSWAALPPPPPLRSITPTHPMLGWRGRPA